MKVAITRTAVEHVDLSDTQCIDIARHVAQGVIGHDRYINLKGMLESWEDTGHGSGLTTVHGEPTDDQRLAAQFLRLLDKLER